MEKLKARLVDFAEVMVEFAHGNWRTRLDVSDALDELDAVAAGINVLVEELQEQVVSKAYLANVLESMDDAVFVVNRDGTIRTANGAASRLFGYDNHETDIVGREIGSFLAEEEEEEEEEEFVATQLQEIIQNGEARDLAITFKARGGTRIPTNVNGSVMRGAEGAIDAVVLVARDIREMNILRAKAEKTARQAAQDWQDTFDAIQDSIFIIDREHRILRANQATKRLLGADVLGRHCYELFHGTQTPPSNCPSRASMLSGQPVHCTLREPRLDNRWFEVVAWPVKDDNGNVVGLGHTAKDITERKQAEARERQLSVEKERTRLQLIQASKLTSLGELAGAVAHEINNPLVGILNNAEFLRDDLRDIELQDQTKLAKWPQYVDTLVAAARRCKSVTDNLLTFGRQAHSEKTRVDLNACVEQTLRLLNSQLRKQDTQIETELPEGLMAWGNANHIQQVLLNLILNAAQALSYGGHIRICGGASVASVWLSIADDGPGIGAEHVDRIFEPFFTTKEKGSGLGLSVSYGIIRDLGGELTVASTSGQGTTFKIELPAIVETSAGQ